MSRATRQSAAPPWGVPDMSVLQEGRQPPPPMPTALFGAVLPVLQAIAENTSSPLDYPAGAFLAICASLIGGKRRVRPFLTSFWDEPPIIWIGLVGDPSARKSPPLFAVLEPLSRLDRELGNAHQAALLEWEDAAAMAQAARKQWEQDCKSAANAEQPPPELPDDCIIPPKPEARRLIINDTTPEGVGVILFGNPMGTLLIRDELAGWLESFERYASSGREFWLETFGGRPFVIDRKNRAEPIRIPFNGVSIAGGIQPDKLSALLLSTGDDGLAARFIFIWPERRSFARPNTLADTDLLNQIYRRLEGLQFLGNGTWIDRPVVLPLSDAAAMRFEQWHLAHEQHSDRFLGMMRSFAGKMPGMVLRLALIAELVAWAATGDGEPAMVAVGSLEAAIEWTAYAQAMAMRVYGIATLPPEQRNAALLARLIRADRLTAFNKRELQRSLPTRIYGVLGTPKGMDAPLQILIDANWVRAAFTREGPTMGRTAENYVVNPAVFA